MIGVRSDSRWQPSAPYSQRRHEAKSGLNLRPCQRLRRPLDRLRADPFAYSRFVNRPRTARVCEVFADVADAPIVRLHGDAHVEQFAFTRDAWGLGDFDDSARGPSFIDIVRFLGSIELATRQLGARSGRALGPLLRGIPVGSLQPGSSAAGARHRS